MNARDMFDSPSVVDSYRLGSPRHPLDLYCGHDALGRPALLLISTTEPANLKSSKVIEVRTGRRKTDGRWILSFSLLDENFKELFSQFSDDMISSSQALTNPVNGAEFLCARYVSWQDMLSAVRCDALSRSELKGLIGEMLFLRNVLIPAYGASVSLQAWMGPQATDQDFTFPDTWYEVKAAVSGAESVRISSVEQLDCADTGFLAVLALDPTSPMDEQGTDINTLFSDMIQELGSDHLQTAFRNALLKGGFYPRPEYNAHLYRFNGLRLYRVDKTFPCLRRAFLPPSVGNATWTLTLGAVAGWQVE